MGVDPYTSILITAWLLGGVAVLLTIGRYIIRFRMHGTLYWDDFTHGVALLALIAFDVLETINFPLETEISAYGAGTGPKPSTSDLDMYFRTVVAAQFAFWPAVYGVKVSFLLFYRQIFQISQNFMRAWWVVMIYVLLTFLASFLSALWFCGPPTELFVLTAKNVNTYSKTLVALNILGDVAIMALPLAMLKSLRMKTSHKLGLACIFVLGFVTIFCDIARIVVGGNGNGLKLAPLWDVLEPTLGNIISCMPTYRGLILPKGRRTPSAYNDYNQKNSRPGAAAARASPAYELSKPRKDFPEDLEEPEDTASQRHMHETPSDVNDWPLRSN